MALANARTFSGSVVSTSSRSEELSKVRCWGISGFGHYYSQWSTVCESSLHSGHVGLAVGSNKWAYAVSSGVCPDRRRARRTAPSGWRWRCSLPSREKCSFIAAFTSLGGGSLMVNRIRAFAVAHETGRCGGSVVVAAAFASSSPVSLPGMPLSPGTQMRRLFLLSSRWRID